MENTKKVANQTEEEFMREHRLNEKLPAMIEFLKDDAERIYEV